MEEPSIFRKVSGDAQNPVEELADEFARRRRRGEHPSITEYCERFPQHADEIRRLFPTVMFLEQLKPSTGELHAAKLRRIPPKSLQHDRLGDFLILREIGRGGMGVVYEAEQHSLGRRVALKVLNDSGSDNHHQIERFEREARSAARLHHTNIVPVFGVGVHDGFRYLVMQLIPGQGLDRVLAELRVLRNLPDATSNGSGATRSPLAESMAHALQTGCFVQKEAKLFDDEPRTSRGSSTASPDRTDRPAGTDTEVISPEWTTSTGEGGKTNFGTAYWHSTARMGIDVARALEHAHSQGVLHRDIKPSNLLLDVHGTVWVADFGLAKADDSASLTNTGEFVGTLRYMSPERFQGRYDQRSEVYSLGLTLYELLTLKPAYNTDDRAQLISQILQARPIPMRQIDPSIPADLETVVEKALAPAVEDRYQTVGELADDLQRYLDDLPIAARPAGTREKLWRWCRRNPTIARFVIGCFILLTAWGGTSSWLAIHWNTARNEALQEQRIANQHREAANKSRINAESSQRAAEAQRVDAQAKTKETQRSLARMHVVQGNHLIEMGDPLGALPHFAKALAFESEDPDRNRIHRMRLAAALRFAPKLLAVVPVPTDSKTDLVSPNGLFFASCGDRTITLDGRLGPFPIPDQPSEIFPQRIVVSEIPSCRILYELEHKNPVVAVTISPDSEQIATGCLDGSIRLWHARTGERMQVDFSVHSELRELAFCHSGRYLISIGNNDELAVHQTETGRLIRNVTYSHRKTTVAFHPYSRTIAIITDPRIEFIDLESGIRLGEPLFDSDNPVVKFVQDGREAIVSGGEVFLRRIDTTTGEIKSTIATSPQRFVSNPNIGADGRWMTDNPGRTVRVWNPDSGFVTNPRLGWPRTPLTDFFNEAGDRVGVLTIDNSFSIWNPVTGAQIGPLLRHAPAMATARFVPDNRYILTRSDDTLRIWDLSTTLPPSHDVPQSMVFPGARTYSHDERYVLGVLQQSHVVRDTESQEVVLKLGEPGQVQSRAFSGDGRLVLAAAHYRSLQLWDPEKRIPASGKMTSPVPIFHEQINYDGSRVAAIGDDGIVRVWDPMQPERPLSEFFAGGHKPLITLSPDGTRIVASEIFGQSQGRLTDTLWDSTTGRLIAEYSKQNREQRMFPVVFSPDSRLWMSLLDDNLVVYESSTGRRVQDFGKRSEMIFGATFLGSKRVATGSRNGTLQIWDIESGRLLHHMHAHDARILKISSSTDLRLIATVGGDQSSRIWDSQTGEMVALLQHSSIPYTAFFGSNSTTATTIDLAGAIRRWKISSDDRPVADWSAAAELMSGFSVDAENELGTPPSTPPLELWKRLHRAYADDFGLGEPADSVGLLKN